MLAELREVMRERDEAIEANRGVKVCGTPGCSLRDWHHGPCEPLRDLCGQRSRAPSRKARCAFVQLDGGRSGEAEAATPHEGEEGPAGEEPLWVQCDRCAKWRLLLRGETVEEGGAAWFCAMNADERANSCDAPQDVCAAISRDMYYVEEIVDQRASKRRAGGWEFRVRWLGWAPEHDTWEPEAERRSSSCALLLFDRPRCVTPRDDSLLRRVTSTTDIMAATWAFVAECPSIGGRGLFARAPLVAGQARCTIIHRARDFSTLHAAGLARDQGAICEYGGPRLPLPLQTRDGKYVLQLPRTRVFVDGSTDRLRCDATSNCDNVPGEYSLPRHAAIFANHSATPNARGTGQHLEPSRSLVGAFP
ncbi:hypothetical protein EMIHUDRAFT_241238 [Emiliania huxleyi CCMP1516]|uniref:Chromo domain-containing protein n=2 Tax=Emiliania huxleyi TaxID=2903 RepID=A0A0D3JD22_EMIH1|nr:hypothetical protein EMIHUDRAFT_241238 [Emiliania huxleyi CCMP1516]EOD21407.1 hypothetical protein EMIHUDRAFT_241238 [Emiliania huxleyi CCMP1516]|eukprot:XP_005773836.1 hypothetical protein EMIHUDRAFT_241238 [Emiliania huxleyi CCMP1516]